VEDEKELRKINKLLLTSNTPEDPQLLSKHNLSRNEILTGVHCPRCLFLPMTYQSGTWKCPKCRTQSKTAFIDTFHDYFHLISPTINNAEARRLLQINSPKMAHHYLTSMNLNSTGKFKSKIYTHKKPPHNPRSGYNFLTNPSTFPNLINRPLNNAPRIK
jgi:hypothetical protein